MPGNWPRPTHVQIMVGVMYAHVMLATNVTWGNTNPYYKTAYMHRGVAMLPYKNLQELFPL